MAPSAVNGEGKMLNGINGPKDSTIDTMNSHGSVHFDSKLQPKDYHIKGTNPDSKILFRDVQIIDSTGLAPFRGDAYIEGERIKHVGNGKLLFSPICWQPLELIHWFSSSQC